MRLLLEITERNPEFKAWRFGRDAGSAKKYESYKEKA